MRALIPPITGTQPALGYVALPLAAMVLSACHAHRPLPLLTSPAHRPGQCAMNVKESAGSEGTGWTTHVRPFFSNHSTSAPTSHPKTTRQGLRCGRPQPAARERRCSLRTFCAIPTLLGTPGQRRRGLRWRTGTRSPMPRASSSSIMSGSTSRASVGRLILRFSLAYR